MNDKLLIGIIIFGIIILIELFSGRLFSRYTFFAKVNSRFTFWFFIVIQVVFLVILVLNLDYKLILSYSFGDKVYLVLLLLAWLFSFFLGVLFQRSKNDSNNNAGAA